MTTRPKDPSALALKELHQLNQDVNFASILRSVFVKGAAYSVVRSDDFTQYRPRNAYFTCSNCSAEVTRMQKEVEHLRRTGISPSDLRNLPRARAGLVVPHEATHVRAGRMVVGDLGAIVRDLQHASSRVLAVHVPLQQNPAGELNKSGAEGSQSEAGVQPSNREREAS